MSRLEDEGRGTNDMSENATREYKEGEEEDKMKKEDGKEISTSSVEIASLLFRVLLHMTWHANQSPQGPDPGNPHPIQMHRGRDRKLNMNGCCCMLDANAKWQMMPGSALCGD